jgi:phage antirepressor YoqD-like protein
MTKDDFDEILRQAGIMFKKGGSLNISKVRRFQSGKNIIKNTKSSADWYSDMFNSPEMQQWINSFTTGEYNNYE